MPMMPAIMTRMRFGARLSLIGNYRESNKLMPEAGDG